MALYLGNIKIAGDGDEGTAIISCDSYEDYQQKLNSGDYPEGTTYVMPDTQASLAQVAFTGSYNDLSNKPTLAVVATTGSYNDLSNKPTIPSGQVQSNWTQTTTTAVDFIKNKPTIGNGTLSITVGSTATTFTANSTENKSITIPAVSVVATLPSSPNANTLYFVTSSN